MQKVKIDKKTILYLSFYLAFVIDLLVLFPIQAKKVLQMRSYMGKVKKELIQFEKDRKDESHFLQEKEALLGDILRIEGKIITAQDISTLSAYISSKAKEHSVDIVEISSGTQKEYETTSQGTFFYLPIEIEAEATFHSLAKFLNVLDKGGYFLVTKELAVKEDTPYHSVRIVLYAVLKE